MRSRLAEIWKLLLASNREFARENGPLTAGAIAFSSVLALVPLALLAVTITGYLLGSAEAYQKVARLFQELLPGTSAGVLEALREHTATGGRFANAVGAAGFLWAASNLFAVLSRVLTTIWVGAPQRGLWFHRAIGLLALAGGGVLFLANIILSSALGALGDHRPAGASGLAEVLHEFETVAPWLVNASLIATAFFLLYRFLPRGRVTSQAALVGALPATALWLISRHLFSLLVAGSSHYGRVYGPLAGAVVLLLWIYYSAYIVLFCAELGVRAQEHHWPAPVASSE